MLDVAHSAADAADDAAAAAAAAETIGTAEPAVRNTEAAVVEVQWDRAHDMHASPMSRHPSDP
jgi:hypothetical protein